MSNRRKFLLQGSMATTAFLAAKPFKSLANTLAPVTGYSVNDKKVVMVHTGNYNDKGQQPGGGYIANLKRNTANLLVLHAATNPDHQIIPANYDASLNPSHPSAIIPGDYRIIYKGDIRIGIVAAGNNETGAVEKINALSAYLKKEKNCHIVVCLSELGYNTKNALDDKALAAASSHLDVIIGGHAGNFCKQPFIARNKNKDEVIINHSGDNCISLRKIEIDFDHLGKKRKIDFTRTAS